MPQKNVGWLDFEAGADDSSGPASDSASSVVSSGGETNSICRKIMAPLHIVLASGPGKSR